MTTTIIINEDFAEMVNGESVLGVGVFVPLKDVVCNFAKWDIYIRSFDGLGCVVSINETYDAIVSYSFGAKFVSLYGNREVIAFRK